MLLSTHRDHLPAYFPAITNNPNASVRGIRIKRVQTQGRTKRRTVQEPSRGLVVLVGIVWLLSGGLLVVRRCYRTAAKVECALR